LRRGVIVCLCKTPRRSKTAGGRGSAATACVVAACGSPLAPVVPGRWGGEASGKAAHVPPVVAGGAE